VWEAATGAEIGTTQHNDVGVFGFAFDPDGKRFAVGRGERGVALWDLKGPEPAQRFAAVGRVRSVARSRNGTWLAWGNSQGEVFVQKEGEDSRLALSSKGDVRTLAFTPDSKHLLAAGSEDARPPRVWETA